MADILSEIGDFDAELALLEAELEEADLEAQLAEWEDEMEVESRLIPVFGFVYELLQATVGVRAASLRPLPQEFEVSNMVEVLDNGGY
ncbi:hypothetical protein FRX31_018539 [Thalictrum thalictroides]|uniref:Uncharacterized protein n=1 Tax=Thalictrum thalictroides TaxID=46969 RepID=A0A7J6W3C0_THATH|nr:hypothetical protein FRX31_018539 [Thalictrum thalictroides]